MNAAERAFYEERARLFLKRFELQRPIGDEERERCMLCFAMGEYGAIEKSAQSLLEAHNAPIRSIPIPTIAASDYSKYSAKE